MIVEVRYILKFYIKFSSGLDLLFLCSKIRSRLYSLINDFIFYYLDRELGLRLIK